MTKREAQVLATNAKVDHVACRGCGAAVGQPCRSCLGNPTMPHTTRVLAAQEHDRARGTPSPAEAW